MRFDYVPELDGTQENVALYARIAQAIANDVARGRLAPGDKLPGTRRLAQALDVHRNTLNAAIAELVAQGWVEAQPARGVFVRALESGERPRPFARRAARRQRVPEKMALALYPSAPLLIGRAPAPRVIDMRGGVPDPRLFPRQLLARAYRRALLRRADSVLDYSDARGDTRLRSSVAEILSTMRGLSAKADDVLIARGSQQALWLAAHALLKKGDRVAVEAFGYPPAMAALRAAGATLVPVAVDRDGLRVSALERVLRDGAIRALYVTPHHQYPTMVSMSGQRRIALLALARVHRFAILEDDYSFEFHYDGQPRLPLASADHEGHVVYVGSMSKVLAPGLRVGYAVAPRNLLDRMAGLRTMIDRQGDAIGEAAIAELMEDGDVTRHIRKVRRIYKQRRDVLASLLARTFREQLSFEIPAGGMALWVKTDPKIDVEAWVARARERGLLFRAGSEMSLVSRRIPYLRIGFTRTNEPELHEALQILRKTIAI
jgi:GntR family transcriptional regulator/MocR family aminotransferase